MQVWTLMLLICPVKWTHLIPVTSISLASLHKYRRPNVLKMWINNEVITLHSKWWKWNCFHDFHEQRLCLSEYIISMIFRRVWPMFPATIKELQVTNPWIGHPLDTTQNKSSRLQTRPQNRFSASVPLYEQRIHLTQQCLVVFQYSQLILTC